MKSLHDQSRPWCDKRLHFLRKTPVVRWSPGLLGDCWGMKRAQLEIWWWDFDGIVSKKLKQWWLNGIIMLVISHMISPFDPYSYYRWVLIDLGGRGSKFMAQLNNRVRSLSRNDPPNLVLTNTRAANLIGQTLGASFQPENHLKSMVCRLVRK